MFDCGFDLQCPWGQIGGGGGNNRLKAGMMLQESVVTSLPIELNSQRFLSVQPITIPTDLSIVVLNVSVRIGNKFCVVQKIEKKITYQLFLLNAGSHIVSMMCLSLLTNINRLRNWEIPNLRITLAHKIPGLKYDSERRTIEGISLSSQYLCLSLSLQSTDIYRNEFYEDSDAPGYNHLFEPPATTEAGIYQQLASTKYRHLARSQIILGHRLGAG